MNDSPADGHGEELAEHSVISVTRVESETPELPVGGSSVDVQVTTARAYPRDVQRSVAVMVEQIESDPDIAADCLFKLKRGGKPITGLSIRGSEIAASAWGNLEVGKRIIGHDEHVVVAEGVAWDLENNVRCVVQVQRSILTRAGTRYSADMIVTTGMAASSIALRNAINTVIPGWIKAKLERVAKRAAAGGSESGVGDRAARAMAWFEEHGADSASVLAAIGRASVNELTVDDVVTLRGHASAIRDGDLTMTEFLGGLAGDEPVPVSPSVVVTEAVTQLREAAAREGVEDCLESYLGGRKAENVYAAELTRLTLALTADHGLEALRKHVLAVAAKRPGLTADIATTRARSSEYTVEYARKDLATLEA